MSIITTKSFNDGKEIHLELNLIEKRNILSLEMIQALIDKLEILNQDPKLKLLILSGAGEHFCAGGDLHWMLLKEDSSDIENLNQVKLLSKMFNQLYNFSCPVIGNITGVAYGGALGLVSLCDIVVANKNSQFCFSEVKLALIPALIAPWVLKKMPASKVRELMLSGRIFNSQEALEAHLIHFVGDSTQCRDYLEKLKQKLLRYDRVALIQIKRLLNTITQMSEVEAQDYCIQALAERRNSLEVKQRIHHFFKLKDLKNKSN